ncbi:MAG TPA: DNA-processing protein DprA, partial [Gemmataceae bacterium]
AGLADEVAAFGCLVSETPMTVEPQAGMFHARNRLISGLARAVVVVESGERSGTLITVGHAAEQGREVFAVPGNVDSAASAGTLKLIRDGARMIRHAGDLLEDLGGIAPLIEPPGGAPAPGPAAAPAGPPPGLGASEQRVWDCLGERRHIDALVRELGMSVPELSRLLMGMEVKKLLRRLPGNWYERC